MELEQVNPKKIKAVGKYLLVIFLLSLIYGLLAYGNNQMKVKSPSDLEQVLNFHYQLAGFFGGTILILFFIICYNLMNCTEK